jgi:hypothetical protein
VAQRRGFYHAQKGFKLLTNKETKKRLVGPSRRFSNFSAANPLISFASRDHKRIRVGQDKEKGYGKKHEYDGRIVLRQVFDVSAKPLPRK